jgi:hypothetical protein
MMLCLSIRSSLLSFARWMDLCASSRAVATDGFAAYELEKMGFLFSRATRMI